MLIEGTIRRLFTGDRVTGKNPLTLDALGATIVSQGQPPYGQRAVEAVRFGATMAAGTALAPITAWPTTTLTMALWNGSTDRNYFVDKIFEVLASGTPGAGGALLACVSVAQQARPTLSTGDNGGYAGVVMSNLSGRGKPGDSQGVFINAITLTGPQPAWLVIAAEPAAGTGATIATHGLVADVDGGLMVPPGNMLGITYLSGAGTTPLYTFGLTWDEYEIDAR